MRDIALTLVFVVLLGMVFKQPVVGAYLWAWFSLMNPHKLTWGFAYNLPFALIIAVVTMSVAVFTKKRQPVPLNAVTALWLSLVVWMTVTSLFAMNDPAVVFNRWLFVFKIHLMLYVSLWLVIEEKHLKLLVVVVTMSVAFFGIKGGIFTALTGGSYRVWGAPDGMIAGNNELAVALVTLVPFLYWMQQTAANKWLRRGLFLAMMLCILSILGSQSRGALLAVFAMLLFLGAKSQHPFRFTLLLLVSVSVAVALMPDSWTERMDTIGNYQQDESAMSRLWTWQTLWNAAVDRPLVGAGFKADALVVFTRYAPTGGQWEMFSDFTRVWVAHSIYFQMLGEHGFVGLGLYLALWTTVWFRCGRVGRRARQVPSLASWMPLLMRMTQVSLIGFAVGGAFLSLAYLDLPFYYMGYMLLAERFLARATSRQLTQVQTAKAGMAASAG